MVFIQNKEALQGQKLVRSRFHETTYIAIGARRRFLLSETPLTRSALGENSLPIKFTKFPDDMTRSLFTGKSGGGCPILMISYIDRRVYPCR
jgi:hypothetical protein